MSKLYEIIEQLCKSNGVNITKMCKDAGVSRGALTDLKMGRSAELSTSSMSKLAEYFGVSTDYLLGKDIDSIKANKIVEQSDNEKLSFALFGTSDVDEDVLDDVRKYAQIARRMREENKKEGR